MKKIALILVATLVMGTTIPGPVYAAQKDNAKSQKVEKVKNEKSSKANISKGKADKAKKTNEESKKDKLGKVENVKEDLVDKKQTKQLNSINKQQDKIEEKLSYYLGLLPNLTVSVDQTDPDEVEQGDALDDKTLDTNTLGEESDSIQVEDGGELNEEVEEGTVPDEEMDDEVIEEEELDEELKEYPGYAGKLRALKNRLNAVNNRLDSLASKGVVVEELQASYDRLESLNTQIDEALAELNHVQKELVEEIENDESVEELEPAEDVSAMKEWNIEFTQALDTDTLSNLDIVVLDADKNIVETSINYSEETNSVILTPLQAYQSGESYILFISSDISGENGTNLANSVKMEFSVES